MINFGFALEYMWLNWSPCQKLISYISTQTTTCDFKQGLTLVECSNVVMDYGKYPDLTIGISDKYNATIAPNEYVYAIN